MSGKPNTLEGHAKPGKGDNSFTKVVPITAVTLSDGIVSEVPKHVNIKGGNGVHLLLKNDVTVTSSELKVYFYDRLVETITGPVEHMGEFVPANENTFHYSTHAIATVVHDGGEDEVFVGKTLLVG